MNLDPKTLGDVVRSLLAFIGGFAVSWGWFDSATLATLVSALATVIVTLWPVFFGKRDPAPPSG
jgi:hypothetical protein